MAFIIFQRDIIKESFLTVLKVEVLWFVLLLLCYWIILPLTALSYKCISPKPKKLDMTTTILAHLAGAGPGRIIPGGIGNISITAIHLKKTGLTIEQALGVVITNNVFGLISNALLLMGALFIRPESTRLITANISSQQLFVAALITAGFLVLIQWLLHARSTRREINKTAKQWRVILYKFLTHPSRVVSVLIIALLISLVHTFMLDLSAYALGIHLSIADALIAMSFGVVIGGVFPTPGGIGGVEAGITAALIILGLTPAEAASVAVLFRVATYWQPLLPGTLAYLYLREKKLL
jgi:undecaprenyl-diphosphatase